MVRQGLKNDRLMNFIGRVTPRGKFGPDFVMNGLSRVWWDITTPAAWPAHVEKYGGLLRIFINAGSIEWRGAPSPLGVA